LPPVFSLELPLSRFPSGRQEANTNFKGKVQNGEKPKHFDEFTIDTQNDAA
jgi:hypothetical protein